MIAKAAEEMTMGLERKSMDGAGCTSSLGSTRSVLERGKLPVKMKDFRLELEKSIWINNIVGTSCEFYFILFL